MGASEQVIAVIPNTTLKGGLFGMKSRQHTLVLTDRRIVFARITTAMMKKLMADSRDKAKAEGKGFLGQWGSQLTAYSEFADGYLTMPPDQALAETPENFAIDRESITNARLAEGPVNNEGLAEGDRLFLKTTDKKYQITLCSGITQAREALLAAKMI